MKGLRSGPELMLFLTANTLDKAVLADMISNSGIFGVRSLNGHEVLKMLKFNKKTISSVSW